ncbi:MAG: hypothetical protein ACOY0R_19100 [Chloroflexota bacterium]
MERIVIRVKDRKKAQSLLDFLRSLDFVESVTEKETLPDEIQTEGGEGDFFALAGLWADRDVSIKSIREKAWPYRA